MGPANTVTCGIGQKDIDKSQVTNPPKLYNQLSKTKNSKLLNSNLNNIVIDHQNITKILKDSNKSEQQFNYGSDINGNTLAEIILKKKQKNLNNNYPNTEEVFTQSQIISLLQSLVYALAYLNKKGIAHHNFYPTTIHLKDQQKPYYQIAHPLQLEGSSYNLTLKRKRFSFLSPELILSILNEQPQDQISDQIMIKSDIFAIGMILLECGSMQPACQCYDQENYHIVDQAIRQRIQIIQSRYGPVLGQSLAECLEAMLAYQINNRIGIEELSLLVNIKVKEYQRSVISSNSGIRVHPHPPTIITPNHPQFINQSPIYLPQHFQQINGMQPLYGMQNPHLQANQPIREIRREVIVEPSMMLHQNHQKTISNFVPPPSNFKRPTNPFQQMSKQFNRTPENVNSITGETTQFNNLNSNDYTSTSQRDTNINKKQESLEQRVERILRMSKHIQ